VREAEYCSQVCGAKCCRVPGEDKACPMLTSGNLCSIYRQRYEEGKPYSFVFQSKKTLKVLRVDCGSIHDLIREGRLSEDVARQCCVVHPELLHAPKFERENTPNEDDD
jgi:hypothetical protein